MAYIVMNGNDVVRVLVLNCKPTDKEADDILKVFGGTELIKAKCDMADEADEVLEVYRGL